VGYREEAAQRRDLGKLEAAEQVEEQAASRFEHPSSSVGRLLSLLLAQLFAVLAAFSSQG
jgi:hypothetical protein